MRAGTHDDPPAGRLGRLLERVRSLPPFRADLTLASILLAASAVELVLGLGQLDASQVPWVVAISVGATLPLAWRRIHPDRVMAVVGGSGALSVVPQAEIPFFAVFGILIALYSVAAHGAWRDAVAAAVITAVVLTVLIVQLVPEEGADGILGDLGAVLSNYVLFGTAWLGGYAARVRRQLADELLARAETAERDRELEAERAVGMERARIARELHDVVSHTVSVMVVQAGAARRVVDASPERAGEAIARIEQTGREALAELRQLLAVLRDVPAEDGREPQPGPDRLDELADTMREAGVPVRLDVSGDLATLPPGVGLSAYRIVQEALTNVLKHAGPTRHVDVLVARDDTALTIAVRDDGQGAAASDEHGRGLIGLQERAWVHGGQVTARARRGGGFEVLARLPVAAAGERSGSADTARVARR